MSTAKITASAYALPARAVMAYHRASLALESFATSPPLGFLTAVTVVSGILFLTLLFVPDLFAQAIDQQVGQALNPLARLLIGPVAKGLAIIGLFSFVGFLYAGKWLVAISALVAAIILGLMGQIVTAIFQGSSAASFSLF